MVVYEIEPLSFTGISHVAAVLPGIGLCAQRPFGKPERSHAACCVLQGRRPAICIAQANGLGPDGVIFPPALSSGPPARTTTPARGVLHNYANGGPSALQPPPLALIPDMTLVAWGIQGQNWFSVFSMACSTCFRRWRYAEDCNSCRLALRADVR